MTPDDVERFEAAIAAGGIGLFPADTVYGLAVDPESERAVRRLYELKGRPPQRPAAVMFFEPQAALAAMEDLPQRTIEALRRLFPPRSGPASTPSSTAASFLGCPPQSWT